MSSRHDPSPGPPWQATSRSPGHAALEPLAERFRNADEGRQADRAELLAPRTQIVADREAYLNQGSYELGRRLSDDTVEMFISSDVAGALQQGFARHMPEFVAVHDLGANASLRLLASLAGAAGRPMQTLSIRRQGQGVQLALIQFVEMPLADGTPVRVYATDINADSQTRQQVAPVLLAYSRLGVLLVGPLPPHALTAQLAPLHEAVGRDHWPNHDLLMVPLGSSTALAAHAAQLAQSARAARGRQLAVHVTPHAGKPRQAWAFIGGAWNRLHGSTPQHTLNTDLSLAVSKVRVPMSEAPTEPMPLRPSAGAGAGTGIGIGIGIGIGVAAAETGAGPDPSPVDPAVAPQQMSIPSSGLLSFDNMGGSPQAARPAAAAGKSTLLPADPRWQPYAERCMHIKGSLSCCVFDVPSMEPLAHVGSAPSAERLARQGALLLGHGGDAARALGLAPAAAAAATATATATAAPNTSAHGSAAAEACFSTGGHHLLVRTLPGYPGVAVHLVVLASAGNVTRARMQLEHIEPT